MNDKYEKYNLFSKEELIEKLLKKSQNKAKL